MHKLAKPLGIPLVMEESSESVGARQEGKTRRRDRGRQNHARGTVTDKLFVSWDGEAAGEGRDSMQDYCLIGNSAGGIELTRSGHLNTVDILEFMLEESERIGPAIHVAFGFNYDVNHVLRDVPYKLLRRLYADNSTFYGSYRLEWYPSKWFSINHKRSNRHILVYDTFGFWSTSLLGALRQSPELRDHPELARIEAGKLDRGTFTHDELDGKVIPYFQAEMELHRQLMEELRASLRAVNLVPRKWYGPSAIISDTYMKAGIKRFMNRPVSDLTRERRKRHGRDQNPDKAISYTMPDDVNSAGRASFAGGRFEQFQIGCFEGAVYGYDITSAYPHAMLSLPDLSGGVWSHCDAATLREWRKGHRDNLPFGFYRIRYNHLLRRLGGLDVNPWSYPHPLYRRDEHGRISYPYACEGWYPSHSANAVWRLAEARFMEAWCYEPQNQVTPFNDPAIIDFAAMYDQRQEYKDTGREDLSYALKITLNSGYGKTAQRKGVGLGDNLPAFHQIEWAAHITDHCRARIWRLALEAWSGGGLVAVETDAIYSTIPLDLKTPGLGGIKREIYDGICYLQSGVYFTKQNNKWAFHMRGLDKESLTIDQAREHLHGIEDWSEPWPSLYGRTHTFNGIGSARIDDASINVFYGRWLRWDDRDREIRLGVPGLKRVHAASRCRACKAGESPAKALHDLCTPAYHAGPSVPRRDAWIPRSKGAMWEDREMEDERWN